MDKKMAAKKMLLSRETLRQLSTDCLGAVVGGNTGYSLCYTCGSVCHTNCHSC